MSLVDHLPGTTSPFIPNTYLQFAWDSVSIGNALACWRRYQLRHLEGWQPNGGTSAIALTFGLAFHSGLEEYHNCMAMENMDHENAVYATVRYLLLKDPNFAKLPYQEDVAALANEIEEKEDEDDGIVLRNTKVRTRYHLIRAVVWYLDNYRKDNCRTIILPSGNPAVELSFRVELPHTVASHDFGNYILAGHIDRAVDYQGSFYVTDYKTTKSLSSQFFSAWTLSHQLTGYTFAGGIILDKPVRGAIVDGIALQLGGCKFGRAPSTRTRSQITEYLDNLQHVFFIAEHLAAKLVADPAFEYPMNTASCYFCDFKEICRQPREFRRRYLKMHFHQELPWNPLENR